jgi:hypothetical protein
MYHPEYRVTWGDRIAELFDVRAAAAPPAGVDTTLLDRAAVRDVRGFAGGILNVHLLGADLVRIDSEWAAPPEGPARAGSCAALLRRLRYEQVGVNALRIPMQPRWYQLDGAPHGARLLIRLAERVNPGLPGHVAINVAETGEPARWAEVEAG